MNRIIIAAAGAGKTTTIVEESIQNPQRKTLITTFTENNTNQIIRRFFEKYGSIPSHITVRSWFRFLLSDWVRPYQNALYEGKRVSTIAFVDGRSVRYVKRSDTERYYFTDGPRIYTDKLAEFGYRCNETSNGATVRRIEALYDKVYIDEAQDVAGYDLEIIELLLKSHTAVTLVGDYRQTTYQTNHARKNSQYSGIGRAEKYNKWVKGGVCEIEHLAHSYRCAPQICAIADSIFPEEQRTESRNLRTATHSGIYVVPRQSALSYQRTHGAQVLRYDKRTNANEFENVLNFGESKGLEFDHVLILPHGPLVNWLRTGDVSKMDGSASKVYVAITRARFSVAFAFDEKCAVEGINSVHGSV